MLPSWVVPTWMQLLIFLLLSPTLTQSQRSPSHYTHLLSIKGEFPVPCPAPIPLMPNSFLEMHSETLVNNGNLKNKDLARLQQAESNDVNEQNTQRHTRSNLSRLNLASNCRKFDRNLHGSQSSYISLVKLPSSF